MFTNETSLLELGEPTLFLEWTALKIKPSIQERLNENIAKRKKTHILEGATDRASALAALHPLRQSEVTELQVAFRATTIAIAMQDMNRWRKEMCSLRANRNGEVYFT